MYKSTNGGDTWTPAATGLPPDPLISIFHLVGSTIYAAGSPFCYQTTDAGAHWESLGGLPRETMLAFGSHGATLLAGTIYDGIFSSADGGGTWTEASGGFRARDMVNFLADGAALYANGQGAFRTTDGGAAWERVTATLPDSLGPLSAVYADGATIFVQDGAAGGKLHRTTDGGAAWTQASSGLSAFSPVADILLSGGRLLAAASDVYVSSDNGDSWTVSIAGMGTFPTITRLTPAGGTIYASGNGVYRSTDNGDNWSPARAGIPNFYSVDAFAAAGADLFAGSKYAAAIYRSTNSGDSWTPVTSLPFGGACTSFLARGAALFAMSPNNGIFLSMDRGGTWSGVSGNLPDHTYLYSLAEIGGTLYAGCGAENGVWTRPLSDLTAIEDGPGFLPSGYVLSQNYPNPFNPATTVAFSVPAAGPALLTVVDLFGRVVATLVSGELRPGTYRAAWNAGTAPSGVYYFRLQLGGEVRTRAALLLK